MTELDDEDVPPLEDLSDAVERARARAAQQQRLQQKTREAPSNTRSGKELRSNGGTADATRRVTSNRTQSESSQRRVGGAGVRGESQPRKAFGGFSKGFLLSTPARSSPSSASRTPAGRGSDSNEVTAGPKAKECDVHLASRETGSAGGPLSVSEDSDIPFLRVKSGAAESKGPVIPEVQQAMKEAYPLLNTQEWMTESLLEKIEKHPLLSRALRDPHLAQVLSQFQSNPKAALQAAAGNQEMQQFLKEFCSLMGDHFTELADKEERVGKSNVSQQQEKASQSPAMDDEVKKVLERREVREVLSDPQVQQLISLLKGDPVKAQRMLSTAGQELKQKVQILIDNGLLALQ